jgi:hypothetical protein
MANGLAKIKGREKIKLFLQTGLQAELRWTTLNSRQV